MKHEPGKLPRLVIPRPKPVLPAPQGLIVERRKPADGRKDLPPVRFPDYAKKYLGQDVITDLTLLTGELDEYELLILREILNLDEVLDYLTATGLMDEAISYAQSMMQHLEEQIEKVSTALTRQYSSPEKVAVKMRDGINTSLEPLGAVHHRALLGALISDAIAQMAEVNITEELSSLRASATFATRLARDPLYAERAIIADTRKAVGEVSRIPFEIPNLHFFARKMQLAEPATDLSAEIQPEADEMTQRLRGKKLQPGKTILPIPNKLPWIKGMTFTKSQIVNPLILGSVHFTFVDPMNGKLVGAGINISRLTGDLCLPTGSLASLDKLFADYDATTTFQYLRWAVLQTIEQALQVGTLREAIVTPPVESAQATPLVEQTTEPAVVPAEILPVETSQAAIPENITVENQAEQKVERVNSGNITWEKTELALGRFGVELKRKGKHYKAIRLIDGEKKSIPFPNQHINPRTLSRILTTTLKALGITPPEFMDKYY